MSERLTTAADLWPAQSRYLRDLDVRAAGVGAAVIPPYQQNKPQWPTRSTESYAELRSISTTLFACLSYRANAVASATIRVYRTKDDKPVRDSPLRLLLQNPNDEQSEAEFLSFMQTIADVAGFAPVEKVRSDAGRVVQLWPLRPDWCRPIPRDQAPPDWEYRIPGVPPQIILAEDMLVYTPTPALDRGYTGMSAVSVALRQLGVQRAMDDFLQSLFQRGALPLVALTFNDGVEEPDADSKAAIKAQFTGQYGGAGNWHKVALLGGIKSIERIGYDLNELAYNDLRGVNELGICQAFGIPPILIGAKVGLDRATYSNYGQARTSFYEDTITPLWARLDGCLTRSLVPEFGDAGVGLEFDAGDVPALKADEDKLWTRAATGIRGGFIMVNDARRLVGYDDVAGGDIFLRPADPLAALAGADPVRSRPALRATITEVAGVEVRTIGGIERRYQPISEMQLRAVEVTRKRFLRLAERFAPKLAIFWREQGERIVAALPGERSMPVLEMRDVAEPLIGWDDELDRLRDLLALFHEGVSRDAFETALDALDVAGDGVAWDLTNPHIQTILDQLGESVEGIAETTRLDVQRAVGEALDAGETVDQLGARLRSLFDGYGSARIETVARTESQRAYNLGAAAGYRESGIVDYCQLHDNPKHDSEPGSDGLTCAQRNQLVVRLEDVAGHVQAEHTRGTLAVSPIPVGSEEAV